jgi:hypothetical protein
MLFLNQRKLTEDLIVYHLAKVSDKKIKKFLIYFEIRWVLWRGISLFQNLTTAQGFKTN